MHVLEIFVDAPTHLISHYEEAITKWKPRPTSCCRAITVNQTESIRNKILQNFHIIKVTKRYSLNPQSVKK